MNFKPYSNYKDSGISWIGEIPGHWEVEKLKNVSQVKPSNVDKKSKDNEPSVLLCNYTDVYNNEFITRDLEFMKATSSYDQIKNLSLDIGDIIVTKDSESANDIAVPAIVTEKLTNVVCGYHLAVIKAFGNIIFPKFLFRCFESDKINKQFEHGANGVTRFGLGTYFLKNAYVYFPPLDEQKQIANYLDKKTAKIDETIVKNQKLIELLEEKRTALINEVVTKGLNPDVPMKDSGIEWIGEIPEHWKVDRLKFLIIKNAQYGANCEPEFDESKFDYRYVRITDINDDGSLKDNIVYLSEENAIGFVLHEGDILFARSGATVGKTYLYDKIDGDCCFAGYLIRYVPNKSLLNPKYLLYFSFSKSYSEWIKIVSTQATIQNVSADKYDNLIISLPDINEQNNIISFLDNNILRINKTISKIKENINLLEEYKTSLIHHVVTGKIDVRGEEI